jgi:GMP synthase-like glutamine amidotransferase
MKKIAYVFDGEHETAQMFLRNGWMLHGPDTDEAPDLVIFTGGEDVSPSYYQEANVASYNNPVRDAYETEVFEKFKDTPKVGICRGGQFLNVLSGGRMWQDTDNHGRYHVLTDLVTGKEVFVSSTHHQMMRPSDDAETVAVAKESTYRLSADYNETREENPHYHDFEVLFYDRTQSLCFQPHPEYFDAEDTEKYFFELLERYFKFNEEKYWVQDFTKNPVIDFELEKDITDAA